MNAHDTRLFDVVLPLDLVLSRVRVLLHVYGALDISARVPGEYLAETLDVKAVQPVLPAARRACVSPE